MRTLPGEVEDRRGGRQRDERERRESRHPQPVEETRRPNRQRALQKRVAVDLERDFDPVVLSVVRQLRLPLEQVLEMDQVADRGQRTQDVGGRRGGPVGSGSADRDLGELGQRLLLDLGMSDGMDGNAALSRLADDGLDVRRAAVVPSVGDENDGPRPGQGISPRVVGRKGGDRAHQAVVEQEALRVEGDGAALAGHVGFVERERRDQLGRVAVGHASGDVLRAQRSDEPARRLRKLRCERRHRSRRLQDEEYRRAFACRIERFRLEDLRPRLLSRLVDPEEVGTQGRHRSAARGNEREIPPGARPARAVDLHAVDEKLRRGGERRAGQEREGQSQPRNRPHRGVRLSQLASPRPASALRAMSPTSRASGRRWERGRARRRSRRRSIPADPAPGGRGRYRSARSRGGRLRPARCPRPS